MLQFPGNISTTYKKITALYSDLVAQRSGMLFSLLFLGLASALAEGLGLSLIYPLLISVVDGKTIPGSIWETINTIAEKFSGETTTEGLLYLTVIVFLIKALLLTAQMALATLFVARIREDWTLAVFSNYLHGPYTDIIKEPRGKILQNVVGETNRASKSIEQLLGLMIQAFFASVMIIILILLNWKVMLGVTVMILLFVLALQALFVQPMHRLGKKRIAASQKMGAITAEAIFSAEVVKLLGVEENFIRRLVSPLRKLARTALLMAIIKKAPMNFVEFIVIFCVAITFAVLAAWFDIPFKDAAPIIGTFAIISARLLTTMNGLLSKRLGIASVMPSLTLVWQLVTKDSKRTHTDKGAALKHIDGDIELNGVSFRYGPKRPVFKNISLTIPKGKIVALVGPSGIGKSTLGYLLTRLYEPDAGTISINGRDIKEYSIGSLRARVGYVEQKPLIFNGTIEENICLGAPKATKQHIIEAAKAAGAHKFIMALPDGYATMVEDQGASLSVGQGQRIAIARAIVRKPDLFIIDEGTSSLDLKAEMHIHRSIQKLVRNATVLFITHRTTTLEFADLIYELKASGKIVSRKFKEVA